MITRGQTQKRPELRWVVEADEWCSSMWVDQDEAVDQMLCIHGIWVTGFGILVYLLGMGNGYGATGNVDSMKASFP